MQRQDGTCRAVRRVMREVPAVIATRLDVSGQPEAAALRKGGQRDPALRDNGKSGGKPPAPLAGTSNP